MVYSTAGPDPEPLREPDPRRGRAQLRIDGARELLGSRRRDARPLARLRHRDRRRQRLAPARRGAPFGRRLDRARPRLHQRRQGQRPPRSRRPVAQARRRDRARHLARRPSSWSRTRWSSTPIAVALKFGFLAVLYLFLLWVARSALQRPAARRGRRARRPRRLRRRDRHAPAGAGWTPRGGDAAAAGRHRRRAARRRGLRPDRRRAARPRDAGRHHARGLVRLHRATRVCPARGRDRARGPGLHQRDLPQRRAPARAAAAAPRRPHPHRRLRFTFER